MGCSPYIIRPTIKVKFLQAFILENHNGSQGSLRFEVRKGQWRHSFCPRRRRSSQSPVKFQDSLLVNMDSTSTPLEITQTGVLPLDLILTPILANTERPLMAKAKDMLVTSET